MGKKKQLYNLRMGISIKSERIKFLLKNIILNSKNTVEIEAMASLASEENNRISKMSEKIGRILKH